MPPYNTRLDTVDTRARFRVQVQHAIELLLRYRLFVPFIVGILAVYAFLVIGQARTANPWCDEAWFANPAKNLSEHGRMASTVFGHIGFKPWLNLPRIDEHTYWIMPLHIVVQTAWYRLVGFGVFAQRGLSILFGAVLLMSLGWVVWILTQRRAVTLGTLFLLSVDYFFLTRASDGRMDVMSAALVFTAAALYLWQRERNLPVAILAASTAAAASTFTHPLGGVMSVTAIAVLSLSMDRPRLSWGLLALSTVPFLAGAMAWGAYIMQDISAFHAQMSSNSVGRFASFSHPLHALKLEILQKYLSAFGLNATDHWSVQDLRLLVLAAYIAGMIGVGFNRSLRAQRGVRLLLLWTLCSILILAIADGHKRSYYVVYIVPLLTALLAIWLDDLYRRRIGLPIIYSAIGCILLLQIGGSLYRIRQDRYHRDYLPVVRFIEQRGGTKLSIIGAAELGYGLNFPPKLVDDISYGYYDGARPDLIVIPDGLYEVFLKDTAAKAPAISEHLHRLLATQYSKVYDRGGYRVFSRLIKPALTSR